MARHALTLASITLLASACGQQVASAPPATAATATSAPIAPTKAKTAVKAKAAPKAVEPAAEPAAPATEEVAFAGAKRKLGDFHVYQYSGAFSKKPISLTEQVIALEDDHVLVVDFVLQEGDRMSALRVRLRPDDEIVRVSHITADGETDATVADYDAVMKKTAFIPDSNDEVLGTEHTACLIGAEQVPCDVTTYGVTIGKKQAKLSITRSTQVPGRDIGGDVVASDGKVLYSARLVERGNEPPVVESFAKLDAP